MEKSEAVSKLKKAGYQVQFDSSVVTVLLSKKVNMNSEIKKIRSLLREGGYEASFGVRQIKQEFSEEEMTEQDEVLEEDNNEENGMEEITDIEQFSLEDFGVS